MRRVIGIALGLSVVIGVLVTAFVWPSSEVAPRDVPIAVAGPPEVVAQVEGQLADAMPDAFDVSQVAGADAARAAIEDRDVYGAVVLDPAGPPQVLTASAAGPAVAQMLQGLAAELSAQAGGAEAAPAVTVDDVAPLPDGDPRGIGFNSGALPMVMGGLAIGVAMVFTVAGVWRRVAGAALAAAGGGAVAMLVMQSWLGILEGTWWANAGVFALTVTAVALTVVGLNSLVGEAGIGLSALVMLIVGNPLSGVTSAPEMLPSGWGAFGQLLPPGAGGSLLRSTAYFDGAAAGRPLLVLVSWLAFGLLLAALGARVAARRSGEGGASDELRDADEPAVGAGR